MSRVSGKAYFVYVLWSKRFLKFYIGISEDPEKRLMQHNTGLFQGWSTRYRPCVKIHEEHYADYRNARKREILLKKQKGGRGFFQLTGLDPKLFRSGGS